MLPPRIEPQLATLRQSPPPGPNWLHEIKLDGYRMLCRIDRGKVCFVLWQNLNWTERLPELSVELSQLPVKSAWLDGEIAALRADGVSSFNLLQNSFRKNQTGPLTFWPFDLLHLDGYDLRRCTLVDRKAHSVRGCNWRRVASPMRGTPSKAAAPTSLLIASGWGSRAAFANGPTAGISLAATANGSK